MIGYVLREHYQVKDVNLLDLVEPKHKRPGFPGVKFIHDDSVHWKKPGELTTTKDRYRHRKVILLVRDPRDVLVSLYFEKHVRLKAYAIGEKKQYREVADRVKPYEGDLSSYVKQPVGGIDTIVRFYNIWNENRNLPAGFLLVRYEDLHREPQAQLRRIMDFLGLNQVDDQVIQEAVDFAAFDKMRQMEKEDRFKSTSLKPGDAGNPESFKTRKGKIGGYVEYLSPEEIDFLNSRIDQVLGGVFGYGRE